MHYVHGRQPRGQPRKRLCDVICVYMKSLNLSNEDTNNRAESSRVDTTCRRRTSPCGF